MTKSNQSKGYALLIGVDDYSAYDKSVDATPEDTNNLKGSLNDVRAWFKLCRELGYPAEHIHVLTSPEIAPSEVEGATVGSATKDAILEGVAWLAQQLGAEDKPAGVLSFSGHGGMSKKGLVLCPTNVVQEGDDVAHTVPMQELQVMIAAKNAGQNLTSIFDCCHGSKSPGQLSSPSTLQRMLQGANQKVVVPAIGDRMYFGAEPRTGGFQAKLGGFWYGAFTWAFMTVRSQWSIHHGQLTISYDHMRERATGLLQALELNQEPSLVCRPGVEGMAVFHRGPASEDDETSATATAPRRGIQLDSGDMGYRKYTVTYSSNSNGNSPTSVATIIVPNTTNSFGFTIGTEYWYNVVSPPTTSSDTVYLTFAWTDYNWTTTNPAPSGTLSFTMNQSPAWTGSMATPHWADSQFVYNSPSSSTIYEPPGVCLNWGVQWNTPVGSTPGYWSGSLTWTNNDGQNNVFSVPPPSGNNSCTLASRTTPVASWYTTSVQPG